MLAKFYICRFFLLPIFNIDRNFGESHLPIFNVDRNCGESHDDLSKFLPKGLSAERNDFD